MSLGQRLGYRLDLIDLSRLEQVVGVGLKSYARSADHHHVKIILDRGKPRAEYAQTIERVEGGWRATATLTNRLGVILERHVRFAPTQADAVEAAEAALSGRWVWR